MTTRKGSSLEPTVYLSEVMFELWGFGRPHDWSNRVGNKTWETRAEICRTLDIHNLGAPKFLKLPHPDSGFDVCRLTDLEDSTSYVYGSGGDAVVFRRGGFRSDILILDPGESAWVTTSDCPLVIVSDPAQKRVFVIHASHRNLLHFGPSNYESMSILRHVLSLTVSPLREVSASIVVGYKHVLLNPGHKKYGEWNKVLRKLICSYWGRYCYHDEDAGVLNFPRLITEQFEHLLIKEDQVCWDGVDTYADVDDKGQYVWHSFRRHQEGGGSLSGNPDNGFVICNIVG